MWARLATPRCVRMTLRLLAHPYSHPSRTLVLARSLVLVLVLVPVPVPVPVPRVGCEVA